MNAKIIGLTALLPLLLALPASAAPGRAAISTIGQASIQPIEIRELVIRAQVEEAANALSMPASCNNRERRAAKSTDPAFAKVTQAQVDDYFAIIALLYETLGEASESCAADKKHLFGDCTAELLLGRLSQSPQVKEVIVRGWDPKQKKEIVGLAELAKDPTMANARIALLATLRGLHLEGEDIGILPLYQEPVQAAASGIQGWPVKWSTSELDASKD